MSEIDTYLKKIKLNVRKIRLEKNMSKSYLSKLSGVPLRTLENLESEKRTDDPKTTTLLKVALALEVTLNDLYL